MSYKDHCEFLRTVKVFFFLVVVFFTPGLNTIAFACVSSVLVLSAVIGIPLLLVLFANNGIEWLHRKMCSMSFWLGSASIACVSLLSGFAYGFLETF